MPLIISCTLLTSFIPGAGKAASIRLLLAYEAGCNESARWAQEIGPLYHDSAEGQTAPLLRVNINGPWPDGLILDRRPRVSPTFILLQDGQETGRMEGYSGKADFWLRTRSLLHNGGIFAGR